MSLCFCCIVRQKICCMPLETTDMRATTRPGMLFPSPMSVTVLQASDTHASSIALQSVAIRTHYIALLTLLTHHRYVSELILIPCGEGSFASSVLAIDNANTGKSYITAELSRL